MTVRALSVYPVRKALRHRHKCGFGPYAAKKGWILMHIIGGTVALMLGPFVKGSGLRRRRMQLHRKIGLGQMASIGFSSVAAFYLAAHTDVSWVLGRKVLVSART